MKTSNFVFCVTLTLVALVCSGNRQAFSETVKSGGFELTLPLGLPADKFNVPEDNPLTKQKVELGRLLYFDERLSADDSVSCATCHSPESGFTDNLAVSVGIDGQTGNRSAPTVINRAFSKAQFWDGRAASLEEQAKGPITNPIEMGMPSHEAVVEKIAAIKGYRELFKNVFGRDVNIDDLARAIASFERTVVSGGSAVDRFMYGDQDALTDSQRRGLEIFNGKARCNQCHSGFNFTDEKFHNIGVGWNGSFDDKGRQVVTGMEIHTGAFKTPTLRDIEHTAPYMHDGSIKSLEEVVEFYDKGGILNPFLDVEMKRTKRSLLETLDAFEDDKKSKNAPPEEFVKLNLTKQEKADLVEFMKALSGTGWRHIKAPESFPQ